tara:strand:- start:34638 stop:35534 length:897 start_codon:yes stop_codon:yes gene_type:complete
MIGIFGRGNISEYYVDVFEYLKIDYRIIVRNNDHKNDWIKNFQENIIIENKLDYSLFKKWLVVTNPESHRLVIDQIRLRSKFAPILCEKPFSFIDNDFKDYINDKNLYISMNRRFYPWIEIVQNWHARKEISNVYFYIPEKKKKFKNINESILGNSIHLIDLFFFLFGFPEKKVKIVNHNNLFLINHISRNNASATMEISKNIEDNCFIRIVLKDNKNFYIKPIEILKELVSFKKIPANNIKAYAEYQPTFKEITNLNSKLKPGFESMVNYFMEDNYSKFPQIPEMYWLNRFIKENVF